jgi:hypothetical protein
MTSGWIINLTMKIFAEPDTQDGPLDPVYSRGSMYFQDDDVANYHRLALSG